MFLETGDIALARNEIIELRLEILHGESLTNEVVVQTGNAGFGILMTDATFFIFQGAMTVDNESAI